MIKRYIFLWIGIFGCGCSVLSGQGKAVEGQLLIQLEQKVLPENLLRRGNSEGLPSAEIQHQVISEPISVWLLETTQSALPRWMQWLERQNEVVAVQLNHLVEERVMPPDSLWPNDPDFALQWHLNNSGQSGGLPGADLGVLSAWDITTGGVTPSGDTVVVAVIDGGICPYCPELSSNLWINRDEIAGDGIDNDGNGYFDDVRGWNVNEQNDNIIGSSSAHGTSVVGIISAKGNNGIGISGILWNTQLMFVAGTSGFLTTEAEILGGFEYVYKSRKTWNQTQGDKGAMVVAINCSFGINFGTPQQSPLWCTVIDQLGQEGILTIAAAANGNWDVDEVGDMPSTCPSDYLIAVTSLNHFDQKPADAAWGATSVDVAAYGENIYTTKIGSPLYGAVSGTSFAAPQVAAAVGMLYAAPCPNLVATAQVSPSEGALIAKSLVLESARPVADLQGSTVSGGRLQLYDMLLHYQNNCSECPAPYSLRSTQQGENSAVLQWINYSNAQSTELRWKSASDTVWNIITTAISPFELTGLQPCQTYEFCLRSFCSDSLSSSLSAVVPFTTDGCCEPPKSIKTALAGDSITVNWLPVTAALSYSVRYRAGSTAGWQEINGLTAPHISLAQLSSCTVYEIAVRTHCAAGVLTDYSTAVSVETPGCGTCYDQPYCTSMALSAGDEWIQQINIGDNWGHQSFSQLGYENYTGTEPVLELFPMSITTASVTPGFSNLSYDEIWRIFVDFNMDGDFEDSGELVFDPGYASSATVTAPFITPEFVTTGITRMRVSMKYAAPGTLPLPAPCEVFGFGQVEDYCVLLHNEVVSAVSGGSEEASLTIAPNPARDEVMVQIPESGQLTLWHTDGLNVFRRDIVAEQPVTLPFSIARLSAGTYYWVFISEKGRTFRSKLVKL